MGIKTWISSLWGSNSTHIPRIRDYSKEIEILKARIVELKRISNQIKNAMKSIPSEEFDKININLDSNEKSGRAAKMCSDSFIELKKLKILSKLESQTLIGDIKRVINDKSTKNTLERELQLEHIEGSEEEKIEKMFINAIALLKQGNSAYAYHFFLIIDKIIQTEISQIRIEIKKLEEIKTE